SFQRLLWFETKCANGRPITLGRARCPRARSGDRAALPSNRLAEPRDAHERAWPPPLRGGHEAWPLEVVAGPDATRSPRRGNPLPAAGIAADPPWPPAGDPVSRRLQSPPIHHGPPPTKKTRP